MDERLAEVERHCTALTTASIDLNVLLEKITSLQKLLDEPKPARARIDYAESSVRPLPVSTVLSLDQIRCGFQNELNMSPGRDKSEAKLEIEDTKWGNQTWTIQSETLLSDSKQTSIPPSVNSFDDGLSVEETPPIRTPASLLSFPSNASVVQSGMSETPEMKENTLGEETPMNQSCMSLRGLNQESSSSSDTGPRVPPRVNSSICRGTVKGTQAMRKACAIVPQSFTSSIPNMSNGTPVFSRSQLVEMLGVSPSAAVCDGSVQRHCP